MNQDRGKLCGMARTSRRRKVVVALEMTGASGRNQLMGIFRFLGYEPKFDVRQGLRLAGDWYSANL